MAINISTNPAFTGRHTLPTAAYPRGGAKDETAPGADDGSPYIKLRADDIFGMQQALLRAGGLTPSGNADTALESQYVQMIMELAAGRAIAYDVAGTANAVVLNVRANQQTPVQLFDGMELKFIPIGNSTGAVTINAFGSGVKNLRNSSTPGILAVGVEAKVRYDLTGDDYVLISVAPVSATDTLAAGLISKNWPTIANSTIDSDHDIVFSAGKIISDDGSTLIEIPQLIKRINATWTAGNNNGGRDSSDSLTNDDTFHCFVIYRNSDGATDAGFTKDVTGASLLSDSGYDKAKWVGAVITDASANIIGFTQYNDRFIWDTPILEIASAGGRDNDTKYTDAVTVPKDIRSTILLNFSYDNSNGATTVYAWSDDQTDPPNGFFESQYNSIKAHESGGGQIAVISNLNQEFNWQSDEQGSGVVPIEDVYVGCYGWEIDRMSL